MVTWTTLMQWLILYTTIFAPCLDSNVNSLKQKITIYNNIIFIYENSTKMVELWIRDREK